MAACRREAVQKDIKELETTIARQRDAMARMNGKLADIKATKEALEDDIFNLQGKLDQAAKVSRPLLAPADWKSLLFWQLAGFDSADWE